MTPDSRYRQLLAAVRGLVRCDAAALLRLVPEEEAPVLQPVAVDGLAEEALGRRFPAAAHPRLARLLDSGEGLRFASDAGLPDPYDGLLEHQQELEAVHDCMGAPGRRWSPRPRCRPRAAARCPAGVRRRRRRRPADPSRPA